MLSTTIFLFIFYASTQQFLVAGFSAPSKVPVSYRKGQKKDEGKIAATLAKELMNPLGIQGDRFVVATDPANNNNVIGWAQVKPMGKAQRDPSKYNARPGSYDLEQDVDDAMWDDFENDDSIQVPVGLASLPWTKEYRAMEAAVKNRDQKRGQLRAQREQELELMQLWELSSVYVESAYRGQGIGSELVRRVLKQRFRNGTQPTSVYLLTLATTTDWYKKNFGFEEVSGTEIPSSMALEVTAGNIITKLIGAQLCCMRGTSKTLELCDRSE